MEEIKLPVDKVDIIISEWMGYFLLYEAMLNTVLYARDKYLVKDGLMLPDKMTLYVMAAQDKDFKDKKYGFWDHVYGFNMSYIKEVALGEPYVGSAEGTISLSRPYPFFEADLYTVKLEDLEFANYFEFKITKKDTMDTLVCWFDAEFSRLKNPIILSTSVYKEQTHWKQTLFYLQKPIDVSEGDIINGTFAVKKCSLHPRSLDMIITYNREGKDKMTNNKQLYRFA